MSIWDWVGVALIAIGVAELVLFRYLAPRNENIRRRMPLLVANSGVNVVAGLAFLVF